MNTTMDEDSFGTLLMDDPGDDDDGQQGPSLMMIPFIRTRSILTATAPMLILILVFSTLPTNWLLQIPKRRISLLF